MPELTWADAVLQVLRESSDPMHYTEIADAIAERGLRTNLGATPANSVVSTITTSLHDEVIRVSRGHYAIRPPTSASLPAVSSAPEEQSDDTGLINAFGMYWSRANVVWSSNPRILGQQQPGSEPVDFCGQKGVYVLFDGRDAVYVGRTTDQPMGVRLKQHTVDRLNGRWDRFSWFGVYSASESGSLITGASANFNLDMLIATMEALLIEGLEPPQNRKRGDDFRAVEFLQVEDPEIHKSRIVRFIDELKDQL
jgi:HB1, ASXL, restriction endonuclease HTH domain